MHTLAIQSSATPQVVAQAVATAWDDFWADPDGGIAHYFPSAIVYQESTCAPILNLTDGQLGAAYHHQIVPALSGTEGVGSPLPTQIAIAISIWAGTRTNGTPMKGRFYLPAPSHSALAGHGVLLGPTQTEITNNMSGFLAALNTAGHVPSVWSKKEGRLNYVTKVRVGSKVDTMRSRRNAIPETYQEGTYTGPQ